MTGVQTCALPILDMKRKKELLNEWKNRHPEMGVISISCKPTGDLFLGISKDTKTGYNRHRFQLSVNLHPNKKLQELWDKYGEQEFEYSVVEVLEYENPQDDQTDSLLELLECCLIEMPGAGRI